MSLQEAIEHVAAEMRTKEPIVSTLIMAPHDRETLIREASSALYADTPSEYMTCRVFGIAIRTREWMPRNLVACLDGRGNLVRIMKLRPDEPPPVSADYNDGCNGQR